MQSEAEKDKTGSQYRTYEEFCNRFYAPYNANKLSQREEDEESLHSVSEWQKNRWPADNLRSRVNPVCDAKLNVG